MMTPNMFNCYNCNTNEESKRFIFKQYTIPLIRMRKRISSVFSTEAGGFSQNKEMKKQ